MVTYVAAYCGLDVPGISSDFTVRMGMVLRGEEVVDVQYFSKVLKELGGEASYVVGDELLRSSVVEDPFFTKCLANSAAYNPFMGRDLVNLVNLSSITKMYWLLHAVLVTSRKKSIEMDYNGSSAGNS